MNSFTFKDGNLVSLVLNGEIDVMLHVCNDAGVMGSGIALEVKNRIPEAYLAYKNSSNYNLGTISACSSVINCVSQRGYGSGIRHLDYEALYVSLEKSKYHLEEMDGVVNIGIPYHMGSDRAGGNWGVVLAMVSAVFKDSPFKINVIKYDPNL